MPSLRHIVYSTCGRILIPLVFVGISGVSVNMIAWVITNSQAAPIQAVLSTRWTLAFLISAGCLTWYELKRIGRDLNRQEYVTTLMNELTPDILAICKDMIKQGKITKAMGNIEITSKMLKPAKDASK